MSPREFQVIMDAFENLRQTVKEDVNAIESMLVKYMDKQDKMSEKLDKHIEANNKKFAQYDKILEKQDKMIENLKTLSDKLDKMLERHEQWLKDHNVCLQHVEEIIIK